MIAQQNVKVNQEKGKENFQGKVQFLKNFRKDFSIFMSLWEAVFTAFSHLTPGYGTRKEKDGSLITEKVEFYSMTPDPEKGFRLYDLIDRVKMALVQPKVSYKSVLETDEERIIGKCLVDWRFKILREYGVDVFHRYLDLGNPDMVELERQAGNFYNREIDRQKYLGTSVKVQKAGKVYQSVWTPAKNGVQNMGQKQVSRPKPEKKQVDRQQLASMAQIPSGLKKDDHFERQLAELMSNSRSNGQNKAAQSGKKERGGKKNKKKR